MFCLLDSIYIVFLWPTIIHFGRVLARILLVASDGHLAPMSLSRKNNFSEVSTTSPECFLTSPCHAHPPP